MRSSCSASSRARGLCMMFSNFVLVFAHNKVNGQTPMFSVSPSSFSLIISQHTNQRLPTTILIGWSIVNASRLQSATAHTQDQYGMDILLALPFVISLGPRACTRFLHSPFHVCCEQQQVALENQRSVTTRALCLESSGLVFFVDTTQTLKTNGAHHCHPSQ